MRTCGCGKKIAESASACPHCGAKRPLAVVWIIFYIALTVLVLVVVGDAVTGGRLIAEFKEFLRPG